MSCIWDKIVLTMLMKKSKTSKVFGYNPDATRGVSMLGSLTVSTKFAPVKNDRFYQKKIIEHLEASDDGYRLARNVRDYAERIIADSDLPAGSFDDLYRVLKSMTGCKGRIRVSEHLTGSAMFSLRKQA